MGGITPLALHNEPIAPVLTLGGFLDLTQFRQTESGLISPHQLHIDEDAFPNSGDVRKGGVMIGEQRLAIILLLVPLLLLLPACEQFDRREAEKKVDSFVRSAVEADFATMRRLSETDRDYENLRQDTGRLLGRNSASLRLRMKGLDVRTTFNDGRQATVHAIGTAEWGGPLPFMGFDAKVPIEWEVRLIKRDGKWYILEVDRM